MSDSLKNNWRNTVRNLYRTPWYHIYLLQLENYELSRFGLFILHPTRYFPSSAPWRKEIVWTPKLLAVMFLAVVQHIGLTFWLSTGVPFIWSGIIFVLLSGVYPIFLSVAVAILSPLDYVAKTMLIARAKRKLGTMPRLKIIGIAGSYGKTTVKEFVAAVLKEKYAVLVTPENINTPLGIGRLLLRTLTPQTEILVIEMGEYYRGDVAEICALTPPDIAVVTGINEAHLERLKTLENTVATIFEVVDCSKSGATAVLNVDDENVSAYFESHTKNHPVACFSHKDNSAGIFPTKLLGRYALGSAMAAVRVGRLLGVGEEAIKRGIASVAPIEHRLQPIQSAGGILVIDDSYNGNPEGVHEAILTLSKYADRRKIFITPGLVEMGDIAPTLHETIGRELALVADIVILIKNSVTPSIAKGLEQAGFAKDRIIWFNSALEAHAGLKDILKQNDVILFQNDWGDNYI